MNSEEAQQIILSNCLKIDGKPNSSNKTVKKQPNTEALDRNWWYAGSSDRDKPPGTRGIALFLSYLQISDDHIPMDGLVLSDGYIWLDRAVMRRLDKFGYIRMENGVMTPTKKGRALLAPYLALEGANQPEAIETRQMTEPTSEKDADMQPTNLIFHGPPGTGKTYATAAEALRLCGEPVPETRAEVMAAYDRLRAEKRIEFVTFHQSMSYEDFIEGRQPTTDNDGEGGSGTGFRLETVPGIFRRIASRAESGVAVQTGDAAINLTGRQVFKMSIGRANEAADDNLFETAIDESCTLIGWEDIDFTEDRFADPNEILKECRERGELEGEPTLQSGKVSQVNIFRNQAQIGDIIVVSKGNSRFRAIGEITGAYEYAPSANLRYSHRRAMRWLWVEPDGVPASEINDKNFSMSSIYRLARDRLNAPALERYMNRGGDGDQTESQPFVLIIDEINRANISKVFGELITLIEPDKRTGMPNALKVRLPYSGEEFGVPANLHIVGTMNTADRSIALLDTALRRRFEFREMLPQSEVLQEAAARSGLDLPRILTVLNQRIEYLYDREHQIGHAYFIACTSRKEVDAVMRHKVIPLLAEYFFEDWGKVAAVLGDAEAHEGPIDGGFMIRKPLKAPPGMDEDGDGMPRFRWSLREGGFSYDRLTVG